MQIDLNYNNRKIFILGAGSSVDYKLPIWSELKDLILKKLNNGTYNHSKEILAWLDLIAEHYSTIDECVKLESEKMKRGGPDVEDQIFRVMKDVFIEKYVKSPRHIEI